MELKTIRRKNLDLFFYYDKLCTKYKYNRTIKQQKEIDNAYKCFWDSAIKEKEIMDNYKKCPNDC